MREKNTGKIMAMKKLKKSEMLRRGQASVCICLWVGMGGVGGVLEHRREMLRRDQAGRSHPTSALSALPARLSILKVVLGAPAGK